MDHLRIKLREAFNERCQKLAGAEPGELAKAYQEAVRRTFPDVETFRAHELWKQLDSASVGMPEHERELYRYMNSVFDRYAELMTAALPDPVALNTKLQGASRKARQLADALDALTEVPAWSQTPASGWDFRLPDALSNPLALYWRAFDERFPDDQRWCHQLDLDAAQQTFDENPALQRFPVGLVDLIDYLANVLERVDVRELTNLDSTHRLFHSKWAKATGDAQNANIQAGLAVSISHFNRVVFCGLRHQLTAALCSCLLNSDVDVDHVKKIISRYGP